MNPTDPTQAKKQALLEWASHVFHREGPDLVPRIATVDDDGRVHPYTIEKKFGLAGLVQAAAVLSRSVAPDDLVLALSPGRRLPPSIRGAPPIEWGAVVDIRSRDGHHTLHMLHAVRAPGRGLRRSQRALPAGALDHVGRWSEPEFPVDRSLEDELALLGVPGATRGSPLIFLPPGSGLLGSGARPGESRP